MIIDSQASKLFISGHKTLLSEFHGISNGEESMGLLDMLAAARDTAVADPLLFETAANNLEEARFAVPPDMLNALPSLNVQHWVFLRDTTKCSVFIDEAGRRATPYMASRRGLAVLSAAEANLFGQEFSSFEDLVIVMDL